MAQASLQASVAAVRNFNRLYTRHLGVLEEHFLNSPFSLAEARVLYELSRNNRMTAKEIAAALGLDAGYLSRILDRFSRAQLITRESSADDRRLSVIALTRKGCAAFATFDKRSREEVRKMLKSLSERDQVRAVDAIQTLASLIGGDQRGRPAITLRTHRYGDMSWFLARQIEVYAQEYGWRSRFETMMSRIATDILENFDQSRERIWVAEMDGNRVGSVCVVADSKSVARLRLLLVEPEARGFGVGKRLVQECVRFAREAAYKKIILWTQSVLVSARTLYVEAGFKKVSETAHKSFGKKLVGEIWELKL